MPRIPIPFGLALLSVSLGAANFSFYATMRAGRNAGGDWEQGLGSGSSASTVTSSFSWSNANPHWRAGDQPQSFRIGYDAAQNQAYLSVWDSANVANTIRFNNSNPALDASAHWTLPASSFFVSASNRVVPTSITLENLSLSPGVLVLSGSLPSTFGVGQSGNGGAQLATLPSTIVFQPASSGGDWYLSGTVRFSGLAATGPGARGSMLQLMMNASGTNNPEPAAFVLLGLGLAAIFLRGARAGCVEEPPQRP